MFLFFLLISAVPVKTLERYPNSSISRTNEIKDVRYFNFAENSSLEDKQKPLIKENVIPHARNRRQSPPWDEARLTAPLIIQKYGYPSEVYTVTTSDGYVLEVHRIPWGVKSPQCPRKSKPVVFLFHDIISSSSDFIINGPNNSLGFLLADAGFDVWLGNARGNKYSRSHVTIPPTMNKFWDFSLHEIGVYDLPAMIDFALNMTEQPQLTYIGHSQGTTTYFIMTSELPEYNNKIKIAYHMSPVAYLTYMRSPLLKFFTLFVNAIGVGFEFVGLSEFLPTSDFMRQLGQLLCNAQNWYPVVCTTPLFVLSGFNPSNFNYSRIAIYMGHTPAGSSTRQFIHYGQISASGVFRQFDEGVGNNLFKHKMLRPPRYLLTKSTAPVVLLCAPMDWFSDHRDVDRLVSELPNVKERHEITDSRFTHMDFIFGLNAKDKVYDKIFEMMLKY